jgi:DNA-binding protein
MDSSAAPRTLAGLWLRSLVLERQDDRKAAMEEMKRRGEVDFDGAVDAAFTVLVRRMFRPDVHVRDIRRFVAQARERFGSAAIPALETEALVRHRLGETDVQVDDIDVEDCLRIGILMSGEIVATLGLSETEVDAVVADSERLAWQRGLNPLLINPTDS